MPKSASVADLIVSRLTEELPGYSRSLLRPREQDPVAMQAALTSHDTRLPHAIESHDGCIVKTTGDGVVAVFGAAADALAAGLGAVRCLQAPEAGIAHA
jgi:class 3 adenylate cyclase